MLFLEISRVCSTRDELFSTPSARATWLLPAAFRDEDDDDAVTACRRRRTSGDSGRACGVGIERGVAHRGGNNGAALMMQSGFYPKEGRRPQDEIGQLSFFDRANVL